MKKLIIKIVLVMKYIFKMTNSIIILIIEENLLKLSNIYNYLL